MMSSVTAPPKQSTRIASAYWVSLRTPRLILSDAEASRAYEPGEERTGPASGAKADGEREPTMRNPWRDIPLPAYEGHMALPSIGQALMLADTLEALVARYAPRSVAILGRAGGNGFDRLARFSLHRVVGVDINPEYLAVAHERHGGSLQQLELYGADVEEARQLFAPVDFLYVALVLEYVDVSKALEFVRRHSLPRGICAIAIQQQQAYVRRVSPSQYVSSLQGLEAWGHWVSLPQLRIDANHAGFRWRTAGTTESADGKRFAVELFERMAV